MYRSYPIAAHHPRERFEYFKGLVDTVFCPMQLETHRCERAAFEARLEAADLGGVQLVHVSTSPVRVARRPQDIAHIDEPPYLVKFQLKGESLWSQRGRQVHARPGDFIICSTAEPYSLCFRGDYAMPVLVLSQATMRRLTPDPEQFLGMRMPGEEADCGLLTSFVGQVVARMNALSEQMVTRVEANILDLLGGVLSARAHRGPVPRAQQLAQIKAYIADHLQDRRLGPALLAQAFGVSTRYVHALFENEGVTVGRYIRSLRVAACRRALEQAGSAQQRSLTELALEWGFYDLSHMTRCFRAEYGEPPGQYLLRLREQ